MAYKTKAQFRARPWRLSRPKAFLCVFSRYPGGRPDWPLTLKEAGEIERIVNRALKRL